MIEEISLRFGSAKGDHVKIDKPSFTIFVGPNNSGKSLALKEIYTLCSDGNKSGFSIIDNIKFAVVHGSEINKFIESHRSPPKFGEAIHECHTYLQIPRGRVLIYQDNLENILKNPNADKDSVRYFSQNYASAFSLNLDGAGRLGLSNPKSRGDLKYPNNSFSRVLTDNEKRRKLRNVIFDAVGMYVAFDISVGDLISLKFGKTPPPNERTIEDNTLSWMREGLSVEAVSDGVKAFSGMLIELQGGEPKIVTIDEPEAFLHPSLAFKLGREIAKVATERSQHVFCSTHSAQFVMGAINSGAKVNIVRLTYRNGEATARLMSNESLSLMMRDPLLRSANVMNGIFYESVVVTEADADRAFYQEVNERLIETLPDKGIPHALFLNANGKDTVNRIVEPLRSLGIPTVPVMDTDALNMKGVVWSAHMRACGIPRSQVKTISEQRASIWRRLEASGGDIKKFGLKLLPGEDLEVAENLFDLLESYGMFILRNGEVEQWFATLNVPRNKTWLRAIFDAMGSDPIAADYIKPEDGDVWEFIEIIGKWLKNPKRRGLSVRTASPDD